MFQTLECTTLWEATWRKHLALCVETTAGGLLNSWRKSTAPNLKKQKRGLMSHVKDNIMCWCIFVSHKSSQCFYSSEMFALSSSQSLVDKVTLFRLHTDRVVSGFIAAYSCLIKRHFAQFESYAACPSSSCYTARSFGFLFLHFTLFPQECEQSQLWFHSRDRLFNFYGQEVNV